jgi:hypothetical protein
MSQHTPHNRVGLHKIQHGLNRFLRKLFQKTKSKICSSLLGPIMILLLAVLLVTIISSPFSSALYDPSGAGAMKMMTEDDWPSHGPWIVTIGN